MNDDFKAGWDACMAEAERAFQARTQALTDRANSIPVPYTSGTWEKKRQVRVRARGVVYAMEAESCRTAEVILRALRKARGLL